MMADDNNVIGYIRRRDWRIWFGLVVTFVWITAGVWFLLDSIKIDPNQRPTLDAVGSFLEGAFAPLAFLWLVLGLFIQQRELARNADALLRSTEQVEKQTLAIAATELSARQDTYFRIAADVKHQMGGITGLLYMSALGPAGSGRINRKEMDVYFQQAASGDSEVFARQLLSMDFLDEGGISEILYGTDLRRKHSRNFRRSFERILALAKDCDVDGIIAASMMNTGFGLLYLRMDMNLPDDMRKVADNAGQSSTAAALSDSVSTPE